MGDFHNLVVWHKAHALTLAVYWLHGTLPEYHLLLARDLGYMSRTDFAEAANGTEQVKRMLRRLVDRLTTRDSRLMTHDS